MGRYFIDGYYKDWVGYMWGVGYRYEVVNEIEEYNGAGSDTGFVQG